MPKILVIDDEEKLRFIVGQALEMQGFSVATAADGVAGLKLARDLLPDLILCDVVMEGIDGYDVLRDLRKDPATATTPFILMTGFADLTGMRRGMTLGADDYLPKPFTVSELLTAVSSRLEKDHRLRELADQKLASLRTNISMMLPHELVTPLTGVLGAAELIAKDAESLSRPQIIEFAQAIHQSGIRLQRLIQNFLIYAQLELIATDPGRTASLPHGPTHRAEQILAKLACSLALAAGRSHDLKLDLCPASLAVSEDHLRKIVSELLDNAFKFSEAGTPVVASSQAAGRSLKLEIRDAGRGMKPEHLAAIGGYMQFERKFYEQQGSGLGLAIAKRLVEIHGGQFALASEWNRGSCVSLVLPLAETS